MRIRDFLALAMLACVLLPLQAQMVEGKVGFKMEASTMNPDAKVAVSMMQGSTLDIYFTQKHARTDFAMGTMMRMVSIIDEEKGEVLTLMSGMIGKKVMRTSLDEVDSEILELSNPTVMLVDEKKEIAGLICSKALLVDSTGKETEIWYTPEVSMSSKGQSFFNNNFPGFPLQFTTQKNGANITLTAYEVTKGLSAEQKKALFEMVVPEGYQEMLEEE